MTEQFIECDDQKLMFAIRCDGSELPELLARHVESCNRCQHRLSELAATEEHWEKAALALAAGKESLHPIPSDSSSRGYARWSEQPLDWNESMVKQMLDPPTHPEMLGRLGRYEIERLIGSGGMGVVFKAFDRELNRPVAIKLLAPYLSANGSARKRFAREARAAAGVVDDYVVPIFNVESESDPAFLVMQYIAGGSLQEALDGNGPMEVSEILRIGLQAAKGLAAAHAQGLIHRDVKPSNILLDEGVERAMLTDFGLARAENDASLTRSGFHPGTPHYMSPEQVRGESIDGRSDLFGLGCVLYAACAGHPPFRAESCYAVLRRITDETPRPLREVNSDIPEWLERIVMKLLAKSGEGRYQSAEEVAELLEACLAHVQQPTVVPLPESAAELVKSFGPNVEGPTSTESLIAFRYPPIRKLITIAFWSLLLLAGIFLTIEANKGTITIESEADNVPIVIKKGGKVYSKLIVNRGGKSISVYAGEYEVTFDGQPESMEIDNSTIALSWGDESVVTIRKTSRLASDDSAGKSKSNLNAQHRDSETCPFCTPETPTIRQQLETNQDLQSYPPTTKELGEYVKTVLRLSKNSEKRLAFYLQHLEHSNQRIADDAANEIRLALHEAEIASDQLDPERLLRWVQNERVDPRRKQTYLRLLAIAGTDQHGDALEEILRERRQENMIYRAAIISALISIRGPTALDLVDELMLNDPELSDTEVYAVIPALRFQLSHGETVDRDRMLKSLHLILNRPQLADVVIEDLIQHEDWSQIKEIAALLRSDRSKNKWLRVPCLRYLGSCPLPQAKIELSKLELGGAPRENGLVWINKSSVSQIRAALKDAVQLQISVGEEIIGFSFAENSEPSALANSVYNTVGPLDTAIIFKAGQLLFVTLPSTGDSQGDTQLGGQLISSINLGISTAPDADQSRREAHWNSPEGKRTLVKQMMEGLLNPSFQKIENTMAAPRIAHHHWNVLSTHSTMLNMASQFLAENERSPGDDWDRHANQLRESSASMLKHVAAKDITKAAQCMEIMRKSCTECHAAYR